MTSADEMIQQILKNPKDAKAAVLPGVLMHRWIDHDRAVGYTSCYANDSYAESLAELIDNGWVVYHIQTEFGRSGHYTMAYLAKMKTS